MGMRYMIVWIEFMELTLKTNKIQPSDASIDILETKITKMWGSYFT